MLKKSLSSLLHFLFLLSSVILIISRIVEQLIPVFNQSVFFISLNTIALLFICTTWFCFCFRFLFPGKTIQLWVLMHFFIPVCLLSVLIATNNMHELLWHVTATPNGLKIMGTDYRIGFYLVVFYAFINAYLGVFLYLKKLIRQKLFGKKHAGVLSCAFGLPLVLFLFNLFTAGSIGFTDVLSLHFSLLALVFFYFIFFYYPFGEAIPYKDFLYKLRDPVVVTNTALQIVFVNPKMRKLLELENDRIIGTQFKTVFPKLSHLGKALAELSFHRQVVLYRSVTYDLNMLPITSWLQREKGKILIFHDISQLKVTEKNLKQIRRQIEREVVSRVRELKSINEVLKDSNQALIDEIAQRRKAERMINAALDEKNILIGEIHHRVKNNLQIIISLLNLQKRYFEDERMREVFRGTVNRIRSIGMIHEKLYKGEDLTNTNIADYINDLAHFLLNSFTDKGHRISLHVDAEKIYLDLNRSILCGLIINELVSNSLKHAFPKSLKRKPGVEDEIIIKLITHGENLILSVWDNGVGIPQNTDIDTMDTLGMKIITTLVKQLKSTMEMKQNRGTEVIITFPKEQPWNEMHAEQQEMLQRIQTALSELPKKVRETTVLYYLDGKSISEVSKTLGISMENVQSQLQTARKHLKELLTKSVS
ncbi:MAG: sigma-70 family RNA polymerase sigma factor [Spirochaetales bacterium]|nr:sigma-70 family RNA polymerase sigma factor [Spirochaetales bacterium]